MEATEGQCSAVCGRQTGLRRAQSRVRGVRPFQVPSRNECGTGRVYPSSRIELGETWQSASPPWPHPRGQGLADSLFPIISKPSIARRVRCENDLQSLCPLRDHAPMNPPERTTPLRATTSSRMRCARVESPTSAALAIFSFSIAVADSGSVPPKFRTVGTVDRHRLRRPPALKVRADPPLETPDIVPSPIVFARPSH